MPSISEILLGILLPAILCGSILSLVWGRRGGAASPTFGRSTSIVGSLAIAAGYWCATFAFLGSIAVPSSARTLAARDWLAWMPLAVVIVAPLHASRQAMRGGRSLCTATLAGLLVWLSRGQLLNKPHGAWILVLQALLVWIGIASTHALAMRNTGLASVLPLFCVALATSIASLISSSALIASLAGALCACLGACVVMSRWNPRFNLAGGPVVVIVVLLCGFWINGVFFSTMPKPAGMCFLLALFAPWVAEIAVGGERGSWRHVFWSCASALVPAGIAVLWSHLASPEPYY